MVKAVFGNERVQCRAGGLADAQNEELPRNAERMRHLLDRKAILGSGADKFKRPGDEAPRRAGRGCRLAGDEPDVAGIDARTLDGLAVHQVVKFLAGHDRRTREVNVNA